MLRTVHLHGKLGREFGRKHRLQVDSPAEAIRALAAQLPGFEARVRVGRYTVTAGRSWRPQRCAAMTEESVELRLGGQKDIHIAPAGVVAGTETIILVAVLALVTVASVATVLLMRAPKAADREEATKVASYAFDGAENNIEQGHPVPLIYGEMVVGSINASSGIVTANLGADPANPPGGKTQYNDPGGPGTNAGTVGATEGVSGTHTPFKPQHPNAIHKDLVAYKGGGKGGSASSSSAPTEAPNNLQSAATARVLEIIGEGEIVGLVDGLKSVSLDGTPLQNPDGTFNFQGVTVEQRVGLPDQDYIQGFAQAENSVNVATQVKVLTGPVTRTINNSDVSLARVTIRVPALMKTDVKTGNITGTKVTLKVSVQVDGGGYSDVYTLDIDGKTNSSFEQSVQLILPPGNVRNIRVTRITADSAVTSLQNDTYWVLLTEVVEGKFTHPDTALIALTVDARQFGSNIPSRSYHVRGLIIEVPTNYDPVARTYTGVWDGTFKRAWCNNPAWVLRDLIVNRRYGLGNRVPAGAVDKWALYAIAQYCDELVPDMFGGTHPRYTINTCISTELEAFDLLASVASNFRGLVHWGTGTVVCTQDRPVDPSILLTKSNVVEGKFNYGRVTPHNKRRSVAVVYWNDPEEGYKLQPEVVENADLIRRFGRRVGQEVTAFGVTNRGQAHRMAKWMLEDEAAGSNATVSYAVGDDHAFVAPGGVAMVADPMFTATRRGGRVRASAANSITIDKPFEFVAGQVYTLRVMMTDGTVRTRAVTNPAGLTDVVTLGGGAFATLPKAGAVWSIESAAVANRQFRVRQIDTDEPPYGVKAVLHDPTKYARVEQEVDLETPNYFDLPSGPLGIPTDLGITEYLLGDGTATVPCALFAWQPPDDPRVLFFQARYREVDGDWASLEDSIEPQRTVRNIAVGDYEFQVRCVDALGRRTAWQGDTATMDGFADQMPEVVAPGAVVNEDLFTVKLTWFAPVDKRPLRYEIMFDAAGDYEEAVSVGVTDRLEYAITEPGTYWVRTQFITTVSPDPEPIVVSPLVFSAGIVPSLTNDAFIVEADSSGNVTSYSGATGSVVVMSGTNDVSTSFTLSVPVGGNPQGLSYNLVGQTYTVTGGLDPGETTGTLVLRATGTGLYAGVVLDKVFVIGKARAGSDGVFGPANRVHYSTMSDGLKGWRVPAYNPNGLTFTPGYGTSDGKRFVDATDIAFGAAAQQFSIATDHTLPGEAIKVYPGERLAVSMGIGNDSPGTGSFSFNIHYYKADGTFLSSATITSGVGGTPFGARFGGFVTVPLLADRAALEVYLYNNGVAGNRRLALSEPMVSAVGPGENALPPFVPGPQVGTKGDYRDVKFKRAFSQPATPTGDEPAGWSDGVPGGPGALWLSAALKNYAGTVIGAWTTPEKISGLEEPRDYNSGTTYYLGNTVKYAGGTYIATQNNFSNQPPSGTQSANAYWDAIAARGDDGAPGTPPSAFSATIDVPSGAAVNLYDLAVANGYTGASDATVTFEVESATVCRGLNGIIGGRGIDTGTWPTGSYTITLTLHVKTGAIVDGGGGDGGGGGSLASGGSAGGSGGDAIYCRVPITIVIDGTVRAGGGGGGGGGGGSRTHLGEILSNGGGGGGGGRPNGAGGPGGVSDEGAPGDGTAGTTGANGNGGTGSTNSAPGASGGNFGVGGNTGGNGTNGGGGRGFGGTGGPAGYAVRKNGNTCPTSGGGTITGTVG